MIIVKNRELLIPGPERYIGTTYDTESENRQFLLSRFAQNGVDLSALIFRLDLKYANDATDTVVLDKEVTDTNIILTWDIGSSVLQVPGTLFIQLRAVDDEVTVKWSSFHAALYVERHLNTPGTYSGSLTEIEQMEQDHQYMKGVVDELKSHLDYTHEAEAWAIGKKDGEDVPSTDETYHNNSKYYRQQAERYANGKEDGTPVSSGVGYHDNAKYYSEQSDGFSNVSEAYAKGTVDGTPVSSGQTGYQDNAKYYKDQAAATVADTNTRFDNAVAAVTVNTEVQDARVGADGTTYTVLKNRLDAEHTDVKSALSDVQSAVEYTNDDAVSVTFESGTINANGYKNTNDKRIRTVDFIPIGSFDCIAIDTDYEYAIAAWDTTNAFISVSDFTQNYKVSFPALTGKYKIIVRNKANTVISSEDISGKLLLYQYTIKAEKSYVDDEIAEAKAYAEYSTDALDCTFESGTIQSNNGAEIENAARIRSVYLPISAEKISITVDAKYQFALFFFQYEDRHGYISSGSTSWLNGSATLGDDVTIPTGAEFFRIVLRWTATPSANISPSDVQDGEVEIVQYLPRPTGTDLVRFDNLFVPTACPNIIFVCRDGRVTPNVPPNSKYAIKMTAYNQYDRIRFSISKTTDGEYVAVHDTTINGLAVNLDGTAISGTVTTQECSLSQLNQYDWGLKYGAEYAGLQVPMLDDCLRLASIYNLRVCLDYKFTLTQTDADAISAMLSKYGQIDTIMFALDFSEIPHMKAKNPRYSYLYAATFEQMQNHLNDLTPLLTGYNHVYLALRPMGEAPTSAMIEFAALNNFDIMFSPIESMSGLISLGFDKGVTLMECHYIQNIKTTVMRYADSLINA